MQILGHEAQREELERTGSRAVLLHGPSGVGKWLCASSHAEAHGGAAITMRDGPTVEQARQVVALYRQRPLGGRFTVTLADLDASSRAVQNTLLKTIEEMPEWGQIVMVSARPVLPTIVSRSQVIEFRPLSDEDVGGALVGAGVSPAQAEQLAILGSGSVERALAFQNTAQEKPVVMQYLDAVQRHDRSALMAMMPRWTAGTKTLLWRWYNEVLADWPRVFTKEELAVVHKIGVDNFYRMVELQKAGYSLDSIAYEVWRKR